MPKLFVLLWDGKLCFVMKIMVFRAFPGKKLYWTRFMKYLFDE